MKKLLILILSFLFMMTAGCATHYTIYMKNGDQYTSVGDPKYSKDSNSVKFENPNGQTVVVQKEDIDKIVEVND